MVALVIALACALAPLSVVAQETNPAQESSSSNDSYYDAYFMSDEHRQKIYEQNRKSQGKALLLNLAFPGLGAIYAEQYMVAGVAIVFMVFAATFVGYGISTRQRGIVVMGGVTAAVAYGGSILVGVHGVNVFNRKLREGLKVDGSAHSELWTPALTLRF